MTLTIDDPLTLPSPDHTYYPQVEYAPWDPDLPWISMDLDIKLQPDFIVDVRRRHGEGVCCNLCNDHR